MRSISIMNQKGGVGKTTTAVNLSAALAREGHRVCLIDLDPQAHASLHLGLALRDGEPSTYDLLTRETDISVIRRKVRDNLWVMPACLDLAAVEIELADHPNRETVLRRRLAADDASYDYLIIDCPPSLGLLTLNALSTVDEVLLPLQPHFLALHGLSKLLKTIEVISQRLNGRLHLGGVVFCMYESGTRLAAEVTSDVEQFFAAHTQKNGVWSRTTIFETRIRRNIRLAEAPSHGQSIFEYASSSAGAKDYQNLAAEVSALAVPRTEIYVSSAAA